MEITEVRVKLMEDPNERLQAFCSITFDDCFVVRDLKIIDGTNGLFVAMPSRKLTARCPQCGCKNHSRANYCNQCGLKMASDRTLLDDNGRAKLYADIAHPINSHCRETIQERIIEAFHEEVEKSKQPNYRSTYDDFDSEERVAVADERSKPARSRPKEPVRTDPAHATADPPHIEPAGKPEEERAPQKRSESESHTTSGPHDKSGPHAKPDRDKPDGALDRQPSRPSKPSEEFGHGIF